MNTGNRLMEALCACIRGRQVDWDRPLAEDEWKGLVKLAQEQHVLPMMADSVYRCPAFLAQPEEWRRTLKQTCVQPTIGQTVRSVTFLRLLRTLEQAGLRVVVMKGITCRALYPKPDIRISADEDLLVEENQFALAAQCLEELGFQCMVREDREQSFELGFIRGDGLYIELHKTPFQPRSDALGGLNLFFEQSVKHASPILVEGGQVMGMHPHDHMLYLLLHAYKHLIHSGFGVRQVCDIILWAEHYGTQIDWPLLRQQCRQVRAWKFAQTVFQIGRHYLDFDSDKAAIPAEYLKDETEYRMLLDDLLESGVFGGKDLSRKHSSTITLRTVESNRKGRRYSLCQTLFPGFSAMEGRFPYVKKYPFLLPLAWCQRLVKYGGELQRSENGNDAAESLRIGKQRTRLLKELDIID